MPFPVTVHRNIRIPMADGLTLAADLFLPDTQGQPIPAVIEYTPYHKINNTAYGPRATRYPYFASQGYAFVNIDIRGTGDSEGSNHSPSSPEEAADGLEAIRWCANQPWSSGSVGMIGISYTAGVCYDVARLAPKELKAIILCQTAYDWYDGVVCPGGTMRPFIWENYSPLMAGYNFAPPAPELVGADWSRIWQQRLDGSTPWGLSYFNNLVDGPYWKSRQLGDDAAKIKAATFFMAGWCDWYPDCMLDLMGKLNCPRRALIGPWTHNYPENAWPLPRLNDRYECLRWFDKYLKGIDTDPSRPVDRDPPITVFVSEFTPPAPLRKEDNGRFVSEAQWPPARMTERQFNLGASSMLSDDLAPASGTSTEIDRFNYRPDVGIAAGRYVIGQFTPGWGMADDQRLDEGLSLLYTTAPLTEPLEIAGVPRVVLFYEATAGTTFLSAKLCDVAPDGTSVLVTKGVLNLTHLRSRSTPTLLTPGLTYEVPVQLQSTAYRFRAGHRLRLMISGADFANAWPTPEPYTATIHRSAKLPSRLILPTISGQDSSLPEPSFKPTDFPPEWPPAPQYSVTRDLIAGKLTVNYATRSGVGTNRSSYTIDIKSPADASIVSEFEYPLDRPGQAIRVRSQCTTRSDAKAFHHITQVEITLNGRHHWSKSWAASTPRIGW